MDGEMPENGAKVVLVVEDDEDLMHLVSMLLGACGYRVVAAGNGREALERVEGELPDLILLDMKMPVMGGAEFAWEFRARHAAKTPIIVVTAAADARRSAEAIHADGWLGKPFDPDALLATVRLHVDRLSTSAQ